LQLLAVSGCVRLIADSIATLPIDTYTESQGVKTEVTKPRWLVAPTIDLDWTSWCTQVLTSLLLHGNAYLVVTRNVQQSIVEVTPMNPMAVAPFRDRGMVRYRVNGVVFNGELVHVRGAMLPGSDVGLSPLELARQSIGSGLAAQNFARDQFDNGLKMPGVIEAPRRLLPEQLTQIAQGWRKARKQGANGLPGVLDDGATWKATGVTSEQAQFLQSRQWTAAEIAGQVFFVDPRELGIPVTGTSFDYTNGETRRAELLTKALLPWMIRSFFGWWQFVFLFWLRCYLFGARLISQASMQRLRQREAYQPERCQLSSCCCLVFRLQPACK
jgi:HK97 family phage portal protein